MAAMRPTLLVLALVALAAHPAHAGAAQPQPPRGVVARTLPGGLLVLVRQDDSVPVVASTVVVQAGAVDETPDVSGASHFLEHLLFNGTESRTQEQLYRDTDRLGLYSNAFTRREYTAFQVMGRAEHLEAMLEIQADMLFRSTLPPEKHEKERGIILEEIAQDAARGGDVVHEAFERHVLGALPATGTPESVTALPRDHVLAYYRDRYVPGRMAVLIGGDVTPERAFDAVSRLFPRRPRRGPDASAPRTAARTPVAFPATGSETRRFPLPAGAPPHAFVVLPAPRPDGPEALAVMVLAGALEVAAAAEPPLPGTSVLLELSAVSPLLVVRAPAAGPAEDAGAELARWTERQLASRLDAAAVRRAAASLNAEEVLQAEQPHYHAFFRADLLAARAAATMEALDRLPAEPAAESVLALARSLAAGPRLVILADVEGSAAPAAAPPPAAEPAPRADPPADALTAAPGRRVLGTGLTLLAEQSPRSGVFAAVALLRDKGRHEAEACLPGAAEVLHRLMLMGTALRGEADISRDVASLGAEIKTVDDAAIPFDDYLLSPRYGYVRVKAPDAAGPEVMRLLGEMLAVPDLSPGVVERARERARAAIEAGGRGGRDEAELRFDRDVRGVTAWPRRGSRAGVDALTAAALHRFASAYLAPGNVVVAVVSPRPVAEALDLAERELRGLGRAGVTGAAPASEAPCATPLDAWPGGSPQVRILLGHRLDVPEGLRPAVAAATAHLSDRLAMVVREEQGLAYSIGAEASTRPGEGWFRVSLATRPENVERAVALCRRVVSETLASPFDEEAYSASLARVVGRLLMRRLTSDNRAFQAALAEAAGEPADAPARALEAMSRVPATVAREQAARLVDPAQLVLVTVP
jgi:predicted Zn-dependent peptidase